MVPAGRTGRLVEEDGELVVDGETTLDDDQLFALIDDGRDHDVPLATRDARARATYEVIGTPVLQVD